MSGPIKERPINWNTQRGVRRPVVGETPLDLGRLARSTRRQLPLIGAFALAGLVLSVIMIMGSIPRYMAVETVLLDEERSELLDQVSALPAAVRTDSAVQSEIEIIKSRALAYQVVDRLGLHEDADFLNPPVDTTTTLINAVVGLVDPLVQWITPQEPSPTIVATDLRSVLVTEPEDPVMRARDRAAALLRDRLEVERVGRSFVIEIAYTGFNARRAAAIARGYGEAYTQFQLQSTTEVAANAGAWIQERLDVLQEQSLDAAAAVQQFRAANNLIQVRGNLLTEQQQSEMATELMSAAAESAQLRARLENFEAMLDGPLGDVMTVSALETNTPSEDVLRVLRAEYLDSRRRWMSVVDQYDEAHPQAVRLAATMTTLERTIGEELQRAIEAIRANYNIARSRENSLRADLASFTNSEGSDVPLLGRLRQLEAISETYASVYQDYLERFEFTTQQQGFPIASVQVISQAEVPTAASSPRKKMMIATGLMLGALLGIVIGAIREMRPALLRTSDEVSTQVGLPCAGLAPQGVTLGVGTKGQVRVLYRTLRRIKQEVDRLTPVSGGRFIGLASVAEGGDLGSLVPSLCSVLINTDENLLLIDAGGANVEIENGIRRLERVEFRSLSELRDVLGGNAVAEPKTGAASGVAKKGEASVTESRDKKQLDLDRVRAAYDYILVLMPPLTRTTESDPLSWILDATVLTIPWGKVSPTLVSGALRDHRGFQDKLATTVLDGANLRTARLYMRPGDYEERVVNA
jgi:polysaccharide biosynthesis transport protein